MSRKRLKTNKWIIKILENRFLSEQPPSVMPTSAAHALEKAKVASNVWLSASEWVVSDTDCYRETNYPDQWGQASDSIITGSLALQQPYAWVWLPVTQQLGTGDERKAEQGHGGGSEGVLIHQDPMSCLVPDSGASPRAAESRSWGLIWPSWRKRAIRVQLVQTEVK